MTYMPTGPVFGDPFFSQWSVPAMAPFGEKVGEKLRRIRMLEDFQPFGQTTDFTTALQRAIDSQAYVALGDRDYPISGPVVDTKGGAYLYPLGKKARFIYPSSNVFLSVIGAESYYSGFTLVPLQGSTTYQIQALAGADNTYFDDVRFAVGNSGIAAFARYVKFRNIRLREMRGSCIGLFGASDAELQHIYMRNGCLGGILPSDGAMRPKCDNIHKWVDPAYWNAYIQSEVDRLSAGGQGTSTQLGGDVYASTYGVEGGQITNASAFGARDGSITFSGSNNFLGGFICGGGHGSGLAIGGDGNSATLLRMDGMKNGIYLIPNFGGSAKNNNFSHYNITNSVEYGICAQDNTYRKWVKDAIFPSDARFCEIEGRIYKFSSATQFGDQKPVHTSGTVSDGRVDMTFISYYAGGVFSDGNVGFGGTVSGSGLGDYALFGPGKLTIIGAGSLTAASYPEVYNVPSRSGVSREGDVRLKVRTSTTTAAIMTTDGAAPQQANTIRINYENRALFITGTVTAVDPATSDLATWDVRLKIRRGVGTAFTVLETARTLVAADASMAACTLTLSTIASRYEAVFQVVGLAKDIDWTASLRITEPTRAMAA